MSKRLKIAIAASGFIVIIGIIAVSLGAGPFAGKKLFNNRQQNTTQEGQKNNAATSGTPGLTGNSAGNNGKQQEKPSESSKDRKRMKDVKVRAVYLSGDSAGNKRVIDKIVELSKATELNAVVIDVKEAGKVNYATDLPEVKKVMANYSVPLYDAESVIKTLHDNNIYVIGRVVCFRDPVLAEKRTDLAVKKVNGQLWKEGKFAWTNPYKEEVWQYNIDIGKEALNKGFDEIQFDYVRFPATKNSEVNYGSNMPSKSDTICKFLETAKKQLHDEMGATVSADVFGIICESKGDVEGIGQELEKVGESIDYISPMIYPSHYANASHGINGNGVGQIINDVKFTAPDLEPYKVVYNSLVKAKSRIEKVQGYNAKIRPYLQAFTASWLSKGYYQTYGTEQIRQQIKAVYDAGGDEWILWNPSNIYPEDVFEKR
ncbi:MAG: putative glycoside hydrolase [Clostridiales bacterium]|jgi:hypothetical protein|nr:putative glycoside hydrolase [Eubacteriales bacterium]MDH7566541.1 putative glycoside hydrolase [Clostridiales bacterium]